MGVNISVPETIKIQLKDIQATKHDYILDSIHYENNLSYIHKAIVEISKNTKIQKVVLKLFLPSETKEDVSKAIMKLLVTKATVVIYGNNLHFFNHPKWIKNWNQVKLSNLQIKFDMMPTGFDYLMTGISQNKTIKILGFRYLSDYQLSRIGIILSGNPSIYHLQIYLEAKAFTFESFEEGIHSTKMPSTPQGGDPVIFLSQNKHITTYTLGGYQERSSFIMGISNNLSIQTLILDNIEIDKNIRSEWNLAFKTNSSISDVKAIRGLSTISALILFQSLRKNHCISSVFLEENVFYDHAFLGLETFLKISISVKNLHIKNLLHLSINQFSQYGSLQNLTRIISGISENNSLIDVYIANHPVSSNNVLKLEKIESTLNEAFFKLFTCNKCLKNLSIENFRLGTESISGISEGLAINNTLEHFSLAGNLIQWDDLLKFSLELLTNSVLSSVDFTNNNLLQSISAQNVEVFDQIFENFGKLNLATFKIDSLIWNHKVYPSINLDLFNIAKTKYT